MVCSVDHGDKLRFFIFPSGPLVRNFAHEYRIFSKMTSSDSCWIAASAGNCFSFLWGMTADSRPRGGTVLKAPDLSSGW